MVSYSGSGGGVQFVAGGATINANYVVGSDQADLPSELVLGTAVIMSGLFADRPAASLAGRLYLATDTNGGTLYRDTGTAWVQVAPGVTPGGTPALVFATSNAAGVAATFLRTDDQIAAFDANVPTTSAVGDAAGVGTAAFAARRDHTHGREAFATPAIVLGTAAAAGVATTLIRSDATIVAFDATAPVTQAFGDAAAPGTAAFAARRDHTHGMPGITATPQFARLGLGVAADGTIPLYVNSGIVGVGDNANANMTTGITINQGAADNQIMAFKSSDVSTGLTTLGGGPDVETDDYTVFSKLVASGGLLLTSMAGNIARSWQVTAFTNTDDTAKTVDAFGAIVFAGHRHNGANANAAFAADSNVLTIMVIDNGVNAARFIFDVEGTAHADVGTAIFNDYNDVELLRGFLGITVPSYQQRFGQALMYNLKTYEDLRLIGKDSLHWEPSRRYPGKMELRAMVNQTGMMMLHHSAILQMHDHFSKVIQSQETRLDGLDETVSILRRQIGSLGRTPEA